VVRVVVARERVMVMLREREDQISVPGERRVE
jgi:hypothetical protein